MRLRSQILVAACGTALACGGFGAALLAHRQADSGTALLDHETHIGQLAFERQWQLRRAERRGHLVSLAKQPYFRAYLGAGDRAQVESFAGEARQWGAEAIAVVDRKGTVLAKLGKAGGELAGASVGSDGDLVALRGQLYEAFRIPVGEEPAVGYLVAGAAVQQSDLRRETDAFGVDVALGANGAFVSTLPGHIVGAAMQRASKDVSGVDLDGGRYRARLVRAGAGVMMVAVPATRVAALTTGATYLVFWILLLSVAVAAAGALVVIGRVTDPIERLQVAAKSLAVGKLGTAKLSPILRRGDEIGELAREFQSASDQLASLVLSTANLSRDLDRAVSVVDRSAAVVAQGADRQEGRLRELSSAFAPLTRALEELAASLGDAQSGLRELTADAFAVDRAHATIYGMLERAVACGTRERARFEFDQTTSGRSALRAIKRVTLQLEAARNLMHDQGLRLRGIDEQAARLREHLSQSQAQQTRERFQGGLVHRLIEDMAGVAQKHLMQSSALRGSADALRRQISELNGTLAQFAAEEARLESVSDG